jgi:hypothetical protein
MTMGRDEIDEYVQRCQQLIESSPQMDEENTKVKLVRPFLELLGWDLYSTEVALEYKNSDGPRKIPTSITPFWRVILL